MPLKVSSQGWVKIAPPPKPPARKRQVDPEEKKDAFCSSLRYFACQAVDPSRERLRMLGTREAFSASQEDLRPHSRLERSSTLDEWRHDVHPPRSSSRQSGHIIENDGPLRNSSERSGKLSGSTSRRDGSDDTAQNHRHEDSPSLRRRQRVASAPVIIQASPTPSMCEDEADMVEVEEYADNASVAPTETPSERHCKHHHRHHKTRNVPTAIPEEDEPGFTTTSQTSSENDPAASPSKSGSSWYGDYEANPVVSNPAPPPTIARSDTMRSRRAEPEKPTTTASIPELATIPESSGLSQTILDLKSAVNPAPETALALDQSPTSATGSGPGSYSVPSPAKSIKSVRSERQRKPDRRERSDRSDTSSVSSRSSRSSRSESSYASSQAETESDTASSYTASTRSVSPVRQYRDKPSKYDRYQEEKQDPRSRPRERSYRRSSYDDDTTSSYPSPLSSPPPPKSRKPQYETGSRTRATEAPPVGTYRDRVATAPVISTSKMTPALSSSTWSSSSGSTISSRSSGSNRSSAPSMDGYQFQAAIFQPKNDYRGYRAPSLSRGTRWETATSALSFD